MDAFVEAPTGGTEHWAVAGQDFGIVFDVEADKAAAVHAVSGGSVHGLGRLAPALEISEATDLAEAVMDLVREGWQPTAIARAGGAYVACQDGSQPELRAWAAETSPTFQALTADGDCDALLQAAGEMAVAALTVQPCSGVGHVFSEVSNWFLHRGSCIWRLESRANLLCSAVEKAPDGLRRAIARE